jgi:tetratricopeptide (TPR) repeat protein
MESLNLRHDLARWLRLAGQLAEAVTATRDLLGVLWTMPALPDRVTRLVMAHLELATALKQLGDLESALDEARRAAELLESVDASAPSNIALSRLVQRTRAACLGERPDTVGQAIEILEALLSGERETGIPYDEAMQIRHDLGSHYGASGVGLATAMAVFRELCKDRELHLGLDDPATLETSHSLASVLGASGAEFLPESLELFTRVARERDRVFGPQNPETLRSRHSVAWVTAELGDHETALREYRRLLKDRERFLGQNHPDTKSTAASLDELTAHTRHAAARAFLQADGLKPTAGETFAELVGRAEETSLQIPDGLEAMDALDVRDPVRSARYRTLTWTRRCLPLSELRVWPGMGGLPVTWCRGSVVDTANRVRRAGLPESATRLKELLSLRDDDQVDRDQLVKWLSRVPLLVVPDSLLHDRPSSSTELWAIDDGCHRAVVLSLLGVESAIVLAGEPLSMAPTS